MAEQFYTMLTTRGKNEVARAIQSNTKADFKYLALGDGKGRYQTPTENDTRLAREVYRKEIDETEIDTVNLHWVKMLLVIPANVGGFYIREVGIFDSQNRLLAIGVFPETYKPILSEGSSNDLRINMIIEVSNASVVNMEIDPYTITATKEDILEHKLEDYPHTIMIDNKRHFYQLEQSDGFMKFKIKEVL